VQPDTHPFGNLATRVIGSAPGPMALRPRLATGLPLSRIKREFEGLYSDGKFANFFAARILKPLVFNTLGRKIGAVKFAGNFFQFYRRERHDIRARRGALVAARRHGAADPGSARAQPAGRRGAGSRRLRPPGSFGRRGGRTG
jgi:hypothetical protein